MTPTIQQLFDRKSVRAYQDRPIDPEHRRLILESAIQAPTAGNMSLFTILEITDPALKEKLSHTCDEQPFIAAAPMVLVFCADYHRWHRLFGRHVDPVRPPDLGDLLLANADALIAAQNAVVAAQSLGIGSCYIGDITENFEQHRELLSLPDYVVPAAMLCLGYPTQQQQQREKPPRFALEELVHQNGYHLEKGEDMEEMLLRRQDFSHQPLGDWVEKFCQRKWNSDFSREMSRSCRAMVKAWCKED